VIHKSLSLKYEPSIQDEGEWHITGSVYVNRKIRLSIPETGRYKSGTKVVTGKIIGWLPAEVRALSVFFFFMTLHPRVE